MSTKSHQYLGRAPERSRRLVLRTAALLAAVLALLASHEAHAQRLPAGRLKNGEEVRGAFREVVAGARKSTVVVESAGQQVALGTVVGEQGWIVTKASQLNKDAVCRLRDGRKLPAEVVGVYRDHDLAMLKVNADHLPAVEWKTGRDPAIGQWLATPGPDAVPVAVGIISAPRRAVKPQRGLLGVTYAESKQGPRITHVFPDSAAAKCGLETGDVLIRVAGEAVSSGRELKSQMDGYRPGDTLLLRVLRDGRRFDVRANLGFPLTNLLDRSQFMNRMGGRLSRRRGGFPAAIQHDSVLSPEQCGGPVVDLSGKVVGINIARAGRTASLAIPADAVLPVLADLKSGRLAPPVAELELPDSSEDDMMAETGAD